MATRNPLKYLFLIAFLLPLSTGVMAQEDSYKFTFAPDVWYNSVDGVRLGVRTLGEVEGTFKDGPHRLDAGFWLSTFFPDLPVSYYVSLTEPIPQISDFGNEGSVQLISSIRTGYSKHQILFNKRWQPGFDEYDYKEIAVYFSQEKLIESQYRQYPITWQNDWKSLLGINFMMSKPQNFGLFEANFDAKINVNKESGSFSLATFTLMERIDLSKKFKLRMRGFTGIASDGILPEYGFFLSMRSPQNWLSNGISRAEGTIPEPWMDSGNIQFAGGGNLRGYLYDEIELLNSNSNRSYQSMISGNVELEFPNPLNTAVGNINIIGDLTEFRTYTFFDIGMGNFLNPNSQVGGSNRLNNPVADAGLGLQISFNIPDYLGKDRGIFIRYDVPFWISSPETGDSNISFRQVIGVGAVISL